MKAGETQEHPPCSHSAPCTAGKTITVQFRSQRQFIFRDHVGHRVIGWDRKESSLCISQRIILSHSEGSRKPEFMRLKWICELFLDSHREFCKAYLSASPAQFSPKHCQKPSVRLLQVFPLSFQPSWRLQTAEVAGTWLCHSHHAEWQVRRNTETGTEKEPTHINYKHREINRHQSAPQHRLPVLNLYGNGTSRGLPGYSMSESLAPTPPPPFLFKESSQN